MTSTYGSIRPQYPVSVFTAATTSGGSITTTGTINLRVQGRNRAGRNLLSDAIALSYTAGQKIQITLNPGIRQSGEDLFKVIIAGERTGNASDAKELLVWEAREVDQVTLKALPVTLELTTDTSVSTAGKPSAYIASTTADGGCDRALDIASTEPIIAPPSFPVQGLTVATESIPITLWYSNGLSEDIGTPIQAGTTIGLEIAVNGSTTAPNGQSYAALFSNKIKYQVLGVVRRSTGIIDPAIATAESSFQVESPVLVLPSELGRGYAVAVAVKLAFGASDLGGIAPQGADISIKLYSQGLFGSYSPIGYITGDVILPIGDRMRIVPNVRLGGAVVAKNFQSPIVGEESFTGLVANTAAQKLCINAAKAGQIRVGEPSGNEAIRAIASTVPGTYKASGWSNLLTLSTSGNGISATVAYPVIDGKGVIRSDYPDEAIRGNSRGAFNVPKLRVFVEFNGGSIYELDAVSVVPGQLTQTFTFTALGTTTVSALPTTPSADFCLFDYGAGINIVAAGGAGSLAVGTYRVAIAYYYPSSNLQITALSHSPADGCVKEMTGTFDEFVSLDEAQTFKKNQFFEPVALASATSVFINATESAAFYLDLAHNATLENPIAPIGVQVSFTVEVKQTGGFTLNFGNQYKWVDDEEPIINTTNGAILVINCQRMRGTKFLCTSAPFSP